MITISYFRNHGETPRAILYFPSPRPAGRVLIIWRRIVRFTVTRVHERAREIAAHSSIFPPISSEKALLRQCVLLRLRGRTQLAKPLLDWYGWFHATPLPFSATVECHSHLTFEGREIGQRFLRKRPLFLLHQPMSPTIHLPSIHLQSQFRRLCRCRIISCQNRSAFW